jgi:hypothetical protein
MQENLKQAISKWSSQVDCQYTFTGSFKQARLFRNTIRSYDYLTLERATTNVAQFIERLSRDILGRSQVRKGRQLEYIGALEGDISSIRNGSKRLHVHLAISGVPELINSFDFEENAIKRWQNSNWGYDMTHVTELISDTDKYRWESYILKDINRNGIDHLVTNSPFRK